MSEKKSAAAKLKPEHVIRCGEATATISQCQSNAGFVYRSFVLGRRWKSMATGRESHGSGFFETHEADLLEAIKKAAAWIRNKNDDHDGARPEGQVVEG